MHFTRAPLLIAALSACVIVNAKSNYQLAACSSASSNAQPAMQAIPTADKTLAEFIAQQTPFASVTGSCVVPAVTGSFADDFTSWVEEVYSWQSKYLSELTNLRDACTDMRGAESYVTDIGGGFSMFCSSLTWISGTRTTADQTKNAGPRETGMGVAAAAAVAGMAIAGIY